MNQRISIVAATAVSALLLAACSGASTSTSSSAYASALASSAAASGAASMDAEAQQAMAEAQKVIGMSEDQAVAMLQSLSLTTRVVSRDGQDYPVTMDYSPRRVNLWIENGVVTNVSVG